MGETDIKKMKVTELREALDKRGLPTEGLKSDLFTRLQARLDEEEFGLAEAPPAGSPAADAAAAVEKNGTEDPVPESSEPAKEAIAAAVEVAPAPAEEKMVVEPGKDGKGADEGAQAGKPDKETAGASQEAVPKVTAEMSFKERMEQRAKRFGIQPSENTKKDMRAQRFGTGSKGGNSKNNQQHQQGGRNKGKGGGQKNNPKKQQGQQQTGNKKRESGGGGGGKKQDQKKQKVGEKPLLPKDEIEKRLARAAKYGTTEGVDELKAMLRKHRFSM
eukprot:CAMPEP_0181099532 /NCGR_PEP_ID=MMETSP1071-20121207/12709_1 /TAXON_ID=35127 /ORGANISM="Thalassiosira sp., Strain NH16" /LENGTH=273 /DNA_ID=CAMNT_0023182199 /DNA_START=92 /DNA_END=913 /DNA_ORIENTATION=-